MRNLVAAVTVVVVVVGSSPPAAAQSATWSQGTAYTLPDGRWEIGLFQPLRYGVADSVEVATHPLINVLMPNLAIKKAWLGWWGGQLSSRHNLTYPTGLLKALSRDGTGGVLPGDTRVPHIIALTNQALYSRPLTGDHVLTAKLGVTLAASFGKSTLPTIDLPIAFTRTAAYHNVATFNVGLNADGRIWGPFLYSLDVDLFLMPDSRSTLAIEQSGMATWMATDEFAVQLGCTLVYGQYPFGTQWHLLPLFDLMWAFN